MTEREATAAKLYENGASLKATARGVNANELTVRRMLVNQGVQLRSSGRPAGAKNLAFNERGPKHAPNTPPRPEPRYSCGHKRRLGELFCETCSTCQCTPRNRKLVARYHGQWLCRCGRLTG